MSLTRASTLDGTGDLGLDVHMKLPLLEFFGHGASDRMQMGRRAGGQPRRAEATVRRMGGYGKERDSRGLLLVRLDRCLLTGQRMTVSHLGALAVGGELCGEGICQDACIHFLRCNIYLCTYVCKEEDEKVCVGFLVTAT